MDKINDIKDVKTPCYIIDKAEYENSIDELKQAYSSRWNDNVIYGYSVKTNHLPYLMKLAMAKGFYGEVVSPAEREHCLRQGFAEDKLIYNGPQKRDTVIVQCKAGGIVNVDNMDELELILSMKPSDICAKIGLRVNFDLEALCPGETTVGDEVGRFGLSLENGDLEKAILKLRKNNIKISGLHMHSSTSSRSLKVFECICEKTIEIAKKYDLELEFVDIGGGYFGGNFFKGKPSVNDYAQTITQTLGTYFDPEKVTLVIEPGAAILATCADYYTRVLNIRDIRGTRVVTVDGTCLHINTFMKHHQLTPCTIINGGRKLDDGEEQLVAGSTCMEMDRLYPRDIDCLLERDSKLKFHCAGAYTMTHNANFINLMPNIYAYDGATYEVIRESEAYMMEL